MTRETLTWRRALPHIWELNSASGATIGHVFLDAGRYVAALCIDTTPPSGWTTRGTVQAARQAVERMLAKTWEADRYTIAPKPAALPPGAYTVTVQSVTARKIKGRLVVKKTMTIDGHPDRAPMVTRTRY